MGELCSNHVSDCLGGNSVLNTVRDTACISVLAGHYTSYLNDGLKLSSIHANTSPVRVVGSAKSLAFGRSQVRIHGPAYMYFH